MASGKRVTTRVDPSIEKVITACVPWSEVPHLIRCLLNLVANGLQRDAYLLSDIIFGGQRPHEYEIRIYKRAE